MEASITPALFRTIYKMRWRNLKRNIDPAYYQYYKNLYKHYVAWLTYKLMIDPFGFLFLLVGVNPSGQLSTLHDNCLAVEFTWLYNFARHGLDVQQVIKIYTLIAAKIVGDDSIISRSKFTLTYPRFAHELGFKSTLEGEGTLEQVPFLNSTFHYDEEYGMYVFKPNYDKLLASVLFYFKKRSWRLTYAKLNAVYILVYPFPAWREQISALLTFVETNYDGEMKTEVKIDEMITYDQIRTLRLSDNMIRRLVYGHECHVTEQDETSWNIISQYVEL
jgi:hypothetical protein